jgi:hypothetical protein
MCRQRMRHICRDALVVLRLPARLRRERRANPLCVKRVFGRARERVGSMERGRLWRLPHVIDQLDGEEDIEHPDVAVSHESG